MVIQDMCCFDTVAESPIERKECWVELEPEAVSRGLSVAELRSRVRHN